MTPPLAKAMLYKLNDGPPAGKGKPANVTYDRKNPIIVQFNPTSLRIQRQNNVDAGGSTAQTQRRQNPSQRPATLTMDLEFDTAEGDENGQPRDVRVLTGPIRQFVEPVPAKPDDAPPRVLFSWGTLTFAGIVNQLTEDLDYFNYDGMALRAKVSLTITEQNLAFEAMKLGSGARKDLDAVPPGSMPPGVDPGSGGTKTPVQAALAQAGESVQQLLTRLDQDPSAWRSAMNGLTSPLSLAAGTQVQLAASASVSAGIGVSAGFAAGASASLAAGAGVSASAGVSAEASADAVAAFTAGASVDVVAAASASASAGAFAGAPASMAAGFALAAGGGIESSYNQALSVQSGAAAGSARSSFQVPQAPQAAAAQAGAGAPSAAVTQVDGRAVSYGRGIPLARRADLSAVTDGGAGGRLVIGAQATATPR